MNRHSVEICDVFSFILLMFEVISWCLKVELNAESINKKVHAKPLAGHA